MNTSHVIIRFYHLSHLRKNDQFVFRFHQSEASFSFSLRSRKPRTRIQHALRIKLQTTLSSHISPPIPNGAYSICARHSTYSSLIFSSHCWSGIALIFTNVYVYDYYTVLQIRTHHDRIPFVVVVPLVGIRLRFCIYRLGVVGIILVSRESDLLISFDTVCSALRFNLS
ncbi:hypothetical protein QBC45DRAFT_101313 [Copromyces sp. CBS 386.78]|nr:hypothetical protein QBC45DRAFT_101313 [Copromyces sp. CBS 386.78]